MNGSEVIIGIDTSNYTTSVALLGSDGELVANLKAPLSVKEGERGLRQSDAVFSHVKNIPALMERVREILDGRHPVAVGVSERPRNTEGSYMPCFLSGVAVAEAVSCALGVKLYRFSHQCGHVMAALYSSGAGALAGEVFGAFHVSGGTTELLRVRRCDSGFHAELVGGTLDLNAGQVIDRIGVAMGLPFPAGPHIEAAATAFSGRLPSYRISGRGTEVNLSGLENIALKVYRETGDVSLTSALVLDLVGRSILSMAEAYREKYGDEALVFAGGVMANRQIRERLSKLPRVYFAEPMLSADNAVGIAELAREEYIKDKNYV